MVKKVIAKKRSRGGSRGKRGGAGPKRTPSTSDRASVKQQYSGSVPSQSRQGGSSSAAANPLASLPGDGSKIVVSNLPDDVSEPQIKVSLDLVYLACILLIQMPDLGTV